MSEIGSTGSVPIRARRRGVGAMVVIALVVVGVLTGLGAWVLLRAPAPSPARVAIALVGRVEPGFDRRLVDRVARRLDAIGFDTVVVPPARGAAGAAGAAHRLGLRI